MDPQKQIHSLLDKHVKIFLPYTGECKYQQDFRTKEKDKP